MIRFVTSRLLQGLVTLWMVSIAVFLMARVTGSPVDVILGQAATQEDRRAAIVALGLDRPLHEQYVSYLVGLLHGDFGQSYVQHISVGRILPVRTLNTIILASSALALAIVVAVPLGVLAGSRRRSRWDSLAGAIALIGMATPVFVSGTLAILIFGVWFMIVPVVEGGWIRIVIPAITLAWFTSAGILRLLRSNIMNELDSDYVRFARLKGLSENQVVWKHAFRNATLPVLTFIGYSYGILVSGTIVAETVFAWPGLGSLAYEAVTKRDFPMIQAITLVWAGIIILVNFGVDVLYAVIDPRVRQ